MNGFEFRRSLEERLRAVAGEDAFWEAGHLLTYLEKNPGADLDKLLRRRCEGEPLQYVLGEWEFFGLPFVTDRRALIPRPDTELLCEIALSILKGGERVLDLCCGSGCIGIALAKHRAIELVSADISLDALSLTGENASRNKVTLKTVQSDLFCGIEGTFDLIVSNPPYLSGPEMRHLERSLSFEPGIALDGGEDGLDFYRRIRCEYPSFLKKKGTLLLEIGASQEKAVCELFEGAQCRYDYGNRPRAIIVRQYD